MPNWDNVNGESNQQFLFALMSSVNSWWCSVTEQSNSFESLRNTVRRQDRTLNYLIRRIDACPLQQLHCATQNLAPNQQNWPSALPQWHFQDENRDPPALLMQSSRTYTSCGTKGSAELETTGPQSTSPALNVVHRSASTEEERCFGTWRKGSCTEDCLWTRLSSVFTQHKGITKLPQRSSTQFGVIVRRELFLRLCAGLILKRG